MYLPSKSSPCKIIFLLSLAIFFMPFANNSMGQNDADMPNFGKFKLEKKELMKRRAQAIDKMRGYDEDKSFDPAQHQQAVLQMELQQKRNAERPNGKGAALTGGIGAAQQDRSVSISLEGTTAFTSATNVAFVRTPLSVSPLKQILVEKLKTTDKINLDLFVMSQCPFGVRAEETIIPLLAEYEGHITIKFHYVASIDQNHEVQSMHGKDEVEEDQRQLLIGQLYPDRLHKYLLARAKNYQSNNWKVAAEFLGISTDAVELMMQSEKVKENLLEDIQISLERKIYSSPTLYIDGQKYGGRIMPPGINEVDGRNVNSALSIRGVNADQCTAVPDGTACTDGNACTSNDVCISGVCLGGAPLNCNDGNACTNDFCNPSTGCDHIPVICNDNDPNTTDACNPATGCVFTPVATVNTHYFRSITSGNWNTPATWESSPVSDFSSGLVSPATISPDQNAKAIIIQGTHIMTVTANVTIKQIALNSSSNLIVNPGIILTVQ